jgi:hypothetical protein
MRKIVLFPILWSISGVASYVYGLPYALDYLQTKTRAQAYAQCVEQFRTNGLLGAANSPITPSIADAHCHCIADPLLFTRDDLMDAVQQKQPAHISQQAETLVATCNTSLEQKLTGGSVAPAPPIPAASTTQPDGTEIVHF